jgi:cytidylate kinase
VVAIDGPAAAGKSTVARNLAERLGAMLFDTGTLYRAVTLAALRGQVATTDALGLAALATERHIDVAPPTATDGRYYDVRLDGEDVTWPIRNPAVETQVSLVSAHPEVRAALLPAQRRIAAAGPVVMVGRDIGTVVVPDAGVKIFLEASLAERAKRRHDELRERSDSIPYEEVLADLKRRDAIDSGRPSSPLRAAPDATVVRTDGLSIDEVVARIYALVRDRWRGEDEPGVPDPASVGRR